MKAAAILAGLALALALHFPGGIDAEEERTAPTACDTDTDCMRHCPTPADDPDCDGGPQDPAPARGDYGTQP